MRHVAQKRVKFGHCDPAKITYYPRYFEWFHDAFEEMFEPITGMHYAKLIETYGVGYPAVQVACDYRAPSRWGDLVDIEIFVSRLREKSATFEYRVRKAGQLLASASVKIATMDIKTHKSAPMPKAVFEALQPYLETDDEELPQTERIR
ncbi:MAG: thioesterase family protein [Myxococcota bacterium]|nr:thioesterase family protein [Myxococcota bacterium]